MVPPGEYRLGLTTDSVAGLTGTRRAEASRRVAELIADLTPTLAANGKWSSTKLDIVDVEGDVYLQHRPGDSSAAWGFVRLVPDGLEDQRHARLTRAFETKLPKLQATRGDGYDPCLVLECRDPALANPSLTMQATRLP